MYIQEKKRFPIKTDVGIYQKQDIGIYAEND